jgi:hypothetical protein
MADGPVDPEGDRRRRRPADRRGPYRVVFEADKRIAAGNCAAVSDDWTMDIETGIAQPTVYFFVDPDLDHNVRAAEVCPAKNDRGVIHVVDRRTGEEIAPEPQGDGTVSVEW